VTRSPDIELTRVPPIIDDDIRFILDAILDFDAELYLGADASELIAESGESWITEMSNEELVNLFTLRNE